ncbi:nucleotide pyrophosphohydrolase [Corynebacterium pseudotuberculosis]|uniref:nucleotide pyrophosphohydrolase n=1 Tax=Corynebacterium pseudotuberculosis TaxID=1719 RepID=UPI002415C6EA|nr:nucleotide pyrophosphohydrolase [Corynebacterium pseudotuberculosis]WFP67105.1 nucleotide pyrophosphohydrolase [Corynebacterium pseudotuberculosis]
MPNQNETLRALLNFREQRNWAQFHSPANLAKSVAIEAGELLECFQWDDEVTDINAVRDELADVLSYAYLLAHELGSNPHDLIINKMKQTAIKYPVAQTSLAKKDMK